MLAQCNLMVNLGNTSCRRNNRSSSMLLHSSSMGYSVHNNGLHCNGRRIESSLAESLDRHLSELKTESKIHADPSDVQFGTYPSNSSQPLSTHSLTWRPSNLPTHPHQLWLVNFLRRAGSRSPTNREIPGGTCCKYHSRTPGSSKRTTPRTHGKAAHSGRSTGPSQEAYPNPYA